VPFVHQPSPAALARLGGVDSHDPTPIIARVDFLTRLAETLGAFEPVLREPGVMVVGSEVPNILMPDASVPLVISRDVDLGVPVSALGAVKRRLGAVAGFRPSPDEPSVWLPGSDLLEVNFLGIDPRITDVWDNYVLEDAELPLLVFGGLSLLEPGPARRFGGIEVPLPRTAGLLVEKLITDRSGEKGDRDLLVALGLLLVASGEDLVEAVGLCETLGPEGRHAVKSNLTVLSLLAPRPGMPDPVTGRERVASFLRLLDPPAGGGH